MTPDSTGYGRENDPHYRRYEGGKFSTGYGFENEARFRLIPSKFKSPEGKVINIVPGPFRGGMEFRPSLPSSIGRPTSASVLAAGSKVMPSMASTYPADIHHAVTGDKNK